MAEDGRWDVGDGRRRPRTGHVVVSVVVAVLLVVGAAVMARQRARTSPQIGVDADLPAQATEATTPSWAPLRRSTASTLVLATSGTELGLFDVDRGAVVDELPVEVTASTAGTHLLARAGASTVVHGADDTIHAVGPRRPPHTLGRSRYFLSTSTGHVWLVSAPDFQPGTPLRVRLVDIDGTTVRGPTRAPEGQRPIAARRDDILLRDATGVRWWRPATGETRPAPRNVLAVSDSTTVACDDRCRTVEFLDAAGARMARLEVSRPVVAAFITPDAREVALLTDVPGTTATALLIADPAGEDLRQVADGMALVSRRQLTWSTDADFVFFSTTDQRLGVLDRRVGTLHQVDVDLGEVDAITTYE